MLKWIDTARDAGYVERFHTIKTVQTYNIAEHVYNSMIIAYSIADAEELEPWEAKVLIEYILIHDSPEVYTGDIPANVKWDSEQFGQVLSNMEDVWKEENLPARYRAAEHAVECHPQLKHIAEIVDKLELLHFCIVERNLGNRNMNRVIQRIIDFVHKHPAFNKFKSVSVIFNGLLEKSNELK